MCVCMRDINIAYYIKYIIYKLDIYYISYTILLYTICSNELEITTCEDINITETLIFSKKLKYFGKQAFQ